MRAWRSEQLNYIIVSKVACCCNDRIVTLFIGSLTSSFIAHSAAVYTHLLHSFVWRHVPWFWMPRWWLLRFGRFECRYANVIVSISHIFLFVVVSWRSCFAGGSFSQSQIREECVTLLQLAGLSLANITSILFHTISKFSLNHLWQL